ncbi:cysteine-rich receptor-like protein kinase 15 isoform X1 [Cannabis sativa]|uniref:cysteine-rich receptor-like protein kinase 15 isoform X1 n=1 Tax=Cannabis sativa TaxID=3483 RepID=UPI0029CA0AB5|nr:cysteine-rich receptor-like protein kinase 15 isoform X1 [Cannabis sativa]
MLLYFRNAFKAVTLLLAYCFLRGQFVLVNAAYLPVHICNTNNTLNNNSHFPTQNSLYNLFHSLASTASVSKFYNTSSSGVDSDKVYGLYMCLGYATNEDCKNCISLTSKEIMGHCPNSPEAVIWEEKCMIRYSNTNFLGSVDVSENLEMHNLINASEPKQLGSALEEMLNELIEKAAYNHSPIKYYAADKRSYGNDIVYAVVQCTEDLSPTGCKTCLKATIENASTCCSFSKGVRILSKSCFLRYELYDFYEDDSEIPPSGFVLEPGKTYTAGSKWHIRTTIIFVVSAFLAVLAFGFSVYCLILKFRSQNDKNDPEEPLNDNGGPNGLKNIVQQHFQAWDEENAGEFPYIDLATIHAATDNFSESNLLGQGGFGPVYKGKLSDGREVAVKRLSSCSEQGSEEFTNEVLLIMKLQHKNLVRLLGFCVNGEEKILLYEYMPNGSLDVLLFDPSKRAQLNWTNRLNIVIGIAKGMLYLHEDSRLRIIHRDLKASNVLLDSHMNPKISDFGMARIFVGTEGEASTCRLVGTYGYMAPEYAMEGLYSVKSDVFSFGVLLLEIISGKKSAGFQQSKQALSLIAYAWQLWKEGRALELMDPLLTDSCSPDEFTRCVYLGLLCVQEDPQERPTMSSIVVMLNSESETLRQPERPAFSWGLSNQYDEINVDYLSINSITMSSFLRE